MVIQLVENNFNNTNQQMTNNYLNKKFNNNDNAFNNKNLINKDADDSNSISSIENINLVDNDFEDEEINIREKKTDINDNENKNKRRFIYQKASTSTKCNKTLRHTPSSSTSPFNDEEIKLSKKNKKRRYVKQIDEQDEDSFVNDLIDNIDKDDDVDLDENEYDDEEIQSRCSSSETTFTKHYKHNTSSDSDSADLPMETDANGVLIEKRHKCDICNKSFPYLSILESHKRCHTGEKPFSCHFCDKKFAQKATLQVHERTHTGERPYKCKYCDKTFAQYGTKTVHEKSAHLGIRNYKCPKCSKCLSSPSALYTHKKTHGDKSFQCGFCPKQFTLKNYLKLHIKQVHEHSERKHICKFCSKTFAYAGSLQVHVRTHTGERPYTCKFCPKAFASQGNLQSHERTHTGERPYTCQHCGRSFIQKSQLTAHEATHAYGNCSELSVSSSDQFDQNSDLPESLQFEQNNNESKHQNENLSVIDDDQSSYFINSNQHLYDVDRINSDSPSSLALLSATAVAASDELANNKESSYNSNNDNITNKQSEFVCKFCGKRYAYASSLYVHTRLHTGERPFRCNFCDKSFTNQGNMQVHLRVHTGEKPYKCEACSKSYAQKVGLKIHQEQCQMYLNRRGSVITITSNDSEFSLSSVTDGNNCDFLSNNGSLIDQTFEENKKQQENDSDNNTLNTFFSTPVAISFKSNEADLTTQLTNTTIQQLTHPTTINISNDLLIKNNNDLSNVLAITQLLENQQRSYLFDSQEKLNEITNTANAKPSVNNFIMQNALSSDKQASLSSTSTNSALLLQSALEQQNQAKQFSQSLTLSTAPLSLQPSISLSSTMNPIFQQNIPLDSLSQQTLANLLIQQLEQTTQQQKQQQQQLQQITALKTLIDLQSISNLPQLLPSLNTYLQPQQIPSSLLPQTQQSSYNQQSNISQQQQVLNSQLLQQQLLTQLLQIQQLDQQQNTLLKNHQVLPSITTQYNHLNNNTIPSTTVVDTTQNIVPTLTDSAAAQFNLVAAAEALHDLSKQQYSQLSLLQ